MKRVLRKWKRSVGDVFGENNGWGFLWLGGVSVLVCLSPGLARGVAYGDWTSLGRLAAGVSVLVVLGAVLFAIRTWLRDRSYELGRELLDVFEDYDLEFEGEAPDDAPVYDRVAAFGEGMDDAPEVVGEWSGRFVRVRRGIGGRERSVYEVDVSGDVPEDLVIRNRSLPTLAAKYVGFEELAPDHARFERTYIVRARHPDRGAQVLAELRLDELFGDTLAERAPDVHLEEGRLRVVREQGPERAEAVAERLEQLRRATEAFVRHIETARS